MIRALAAVVVMWSSVALAQSAGAQAEALFRQGRDLMAAGNLAEACSAFEESQRIEPAVTTLLNLAGCREKLGQIATAWGLFLEAVRQTRSASDPSGQQLHGIAEDRAQKLEPRVSKLTINVPLHSQVDGLEITRGTERVNAVLWNRAQPVDGGTYKITARAPGANQWSTQVRVEPEGDIKTVEIPDLRNLPRDLEPAPPVTAMPVDHPSVPRPRSRSIVPFVLGAGALALLGGGLALELRAESRYDAARDEMTDQARRNSLYHEANTRRYVAEALAATGLAAGGAAVWLYLRDRNHERGETAGANMHVFPTTTGLALIGAF